MNLPHIKSIESFTLAEIEYAARQAHDEGRHLDANPFYEGSPQARRWALAFIGAERDCADEIGLALVGA